ncbi:N-acetylmuramoyl-L-alanine amidase [Rheinheimera sp. MMS21-TC3]|uniref:N-acetylmuramoyl-L-alanine amidase n=1 Tax=Rheinheimera sp. MMS21-TC3 TaxID=3072790 RepID=UPI0028C4C936|nr:N-acetylmuramoyl-L-alanine amidase [Rheinheimera sp. MMS21-TC3]WNO60174.1 N-acetylmuramoyl-L-alanine amidase [Rheinheimera sp. MMS21-TC3]
MKNNNILCKLFILCLAWLALPLFAANQVQGIRIWPSPDSTRVVFDLKEPADHKSFSLDNPDRLVIDLTNTSGGSQLPNIVGDSALIKAIRSSGDNNSMRVVLDLTKASKANVFTLPPTAPYGHRLVVDLPDSLAAEFVPPPAIRAARDIIIAIDAGHGGEDPGSIGPSGFYEKNITLPIAQRLLTLINQQDGMQAMLVRTNDYYVHVNRRTEIARSQKADLLISVHADAFTSAQPRGASVWVLSQKRATTEVGRMLEQTERHSELLGGVAEIIKDSANERYLAQTVLDLSMHHSMTTAHQVADHVLAELGKVAHLHQSKPQKASLGVLKATDIPSILVEVGFISNPQEEKLLRSSSHQSKLAKAMFNAVNSYFRQSPPADSKYALYRAKEHKVSVGESLSVLAQRYKVSVADLRQYNQLSSDNIHVGQVLRIP